MNLAPFFDAALEQQIFAASHRVLAELLVRRAGVEGERAAAIAVATALLARSRDDAHSALALTDLADEATALAAEVSSDVTTSVASIIGQRDARWWRGMLATDDQSWPFILHGALLQFRRYFDAERRIAARVQESLVQSEPTFRVITGGPGTGKTTRIAELLVDTLSRSPDQRIALAAPTGKAAARLSESVRQRLDAVQASDAIRARIPQTARTVHRLLGYQPDRDRFWSRAGMPLPHDLVILDEASMVDVLLMDALVSALAPHATLLLVGDEHQLASVEAGDVLGAICRAAGDRAAGDPLQQRVTRLTHSYRFGSDSAIGHAATAVLDGDAQTLMAVLRDPTRPNAHCSAAPTGRAELHALIAPHLTRVAETTSPSSALDALGEFRILCAERDGPLGVSGINAEVERILRQQGTVMHDHWYHGRPVMVMANDYGSQLFNGDVGIAWVEQGEMLVHFPSSVGTTRAIQPSRLPEVQTAWAMTVHKAQGSEFDHVLVVLPARGSRVLGRELLYTAITRAKRQVHIVGDDGVIQSAVSRTAKRGSGLQAMLQPQSAGMNGTTI